MYKCDVCKRDIFKADRMGGYTLCSKHMHQLFSHGRFLDNIPRTQKDLNEYRIVGDEAFGGLYRNPSSEKIGEFIIDAEDLPTVRYHKWRISHSHVVTGLPSKGTQRDLSWIVLHLDNRDEKNRGIVVDHIDGNPLNNKKSNLRICTQAENTLNKKFMSNNTIGFIGVSFKKERGVYDPEIRSGRIRCHLGHEKRLVDAVYKRAFAETIVFGAYANESEQRRKFDFTKDIPEERKRQLENIVIQKLNNKIFGNKLCRSAEYAG